MSRTVVEYFGNDDNGSQCGYCKKEDGSLAHGMYWKTTKQSKASAWAESSQNLWKWKLFSLAKGINSPVMDKLHHVYLMYIYIYIWLVYLCRGKFIWVLFLSSCLLVTYIYIYSIFIYSFLFIPGMWAHVLTCQDYQDLLDRGWRRLIIIYIYILQKRDFFQEKHFTWSFSLWSCEVFCQIKVLFLLLAIHKIFILVKDF